MPSIRSLPPTTGSTTRARGLLVASVLYGE
jgi:hypothetical protein